MPTLAEYKKGTQDPFKAGLIEIYLNNAPFLQYLDFDDINGGAITFTREKTLPDAGFRVVGSKFVESFGELEEVTESLKIGGGKIEIDRALRKMYGDARLATAIDMKIKAFARVASLTFFKGDGTAGSFTGLQSRVGASQSIDQGGTALSLKNLTRAVLECEGTNKVIFAGLEMYLLLDTASKSSTIGSQVTITQDQFGKPMMYYAGVPVVLAGEDVNGDQILDFSEALSTTSIYVVSFDGNGVQGVQNGEIETYYPKKDAVDSEIDVEWLMNYLLQNPDSVYRVYNIINGAVTE